MRTVLVTGSGGLIGSESVLHFADHADHVVGLDNDARAEFFGPEASTAWQVAQLNERLSNYRHHHLDIRDADALDLIFREHGADLDLVVHAAAQPSHDWAARAPHVDFATNATATLNLLESCREHSPDAVFLFTSTNKVYGDRPNSLPLIEQEKRWSLQPDHPYAEHGIDEQMSVDGSTHSLFGVSKLSADMMVQEYGRYFGMRTGVFRGGCLTGPGHSGAQLHGFLAYLLKCTLTGDPYTVFGYKGKQVRDNIHSADLVAAFDAFAREPRGGEAYNLGGGPASNCSMLEAIDLCQELTGRRLNWTYSDQARIGDHIWWVSDVRKFTAHYPGWQVRYDVRAILEDMIENAGDRLCAGRAG